MPEAPGPATFERWFELSQFLYREAALLDARDWDAWGGLFTAEGRYWIPATREQSDWVNHVSLVNDNSLLRSIRLSRLKNGEAASLHGNPDSSHLVSNIVIAEADEARGRYIVCSRFVVAQYAGWGRHTFHGGYTHELVRESGEIRICVKRVDLVDASGPLGDILTIL
jgi:3-phenylpropionate/cinnamic acid dioxygenase small subunit